VRVSTLGAFVAWSCFGRCRGTGVSHVLGLVRSLVGRDRGAGACRLRLVF